MDIQNRKNLHTEAKRALCEGSNQPQKLILLHVGVTALLSIVLSGLDYYLQQQIGTTVGLGGIALRSVLSTIQSVLQLIYAVALPFWQMGYLLMTVKLARRENVNTSTLFAGFHNFFPVLRYQLLLGLIVFGVVMAGSYLAGILYFMTPLSTPLMQQLTPILSNGQAMDISALEEAISNLLDAHLVPLMILIGVVILAIGIPVLYRYRLSGLYLIDHPQQGAIRALHNSRKSMHKHCLDLLKLDLHFWWFYALELLVSFVAYGDFFLNAMGVTLPLPDGVSYFLFYSLSLLLQVAIYYRWKNSVSVTYALAYDALKLPEKATSANEM